MSKITVIHHSADFDGLFCREIARKFLPDAEIIGWDFKDDPIPAPSEGQIIVMDLPVDRVFGFDFSTAGYQRFVERVVWIDHHKSSIDSHPKSIPGYRIDGVAACRLAWQWFLQKWRESVGMVWLLPDVKQFIDRIVQEPLAVRLAGEYDIWDKRDLNAEVFQFGLRSRELTGQDWEALLSDKPVPSLEGTGMDTTESSLIVSGLLQSGHLLQRYQQKNDASSVKHNSFILEFEGLKLLAINTDRGNSLTFSSKDMPETGHDALMIFGYTGKIWKVSLYHAKHRTDLDLSVVAKKYGGGGHRGACGFVAKALPFLP